MGRSSKIGRAAVAALDEIVGQASPPVDEGAPPFISSQHSTLTPRLLLKLPEPRPDRGSDPTRVRARLARPRLALQRPPRRRVHPPELRRVREVNPERDQAPTPTRNTESKRQPVRPGSVRRYRPEVPHRGRSISARAGLATHATRSGFFSTPDNERFDGEVCASELARSFVRRLLRAGVHRIKAAAPFARRLSERASVASEPRSRAPRPETAITMAAASYTHAAPTTRVAISS